MERLLIQCTIEKDLKARVKKAFKDNHMSIASYVLACLIKKTNELEKSKVEA